MWADTDAGLSLAIRTSFLNEFNLDAGVPYIASKSMPIVFMETTTPDGVDLESRMRAASLAGLAIGPAGQPELVEAFIELTKVAQQRRLGRADLVSWLAD